MVGGIGEVEMEDRSRPPSWAFDQIKPAISQSEGSAGLPGVAMRVSRTADDGIPTFMFLSTAKRLRDELDAAIKAAEAGGFEEPPFSGYTMDV